MTDTDRASRLVEPPAGLTKAEWHAYMLGAGRALTLAGEMVRHLIAWTPMVPFGIRGRMHRLADELDVLRAELEGAAAEAARIRDRELERTEGGRHAR